MTRHANRWGLVLLCSLHSLAAPSRWAARAAAPPYQDAELFEMPWTPPMHPFDDKEPFKAAVVGNKILWHHREDSLVITQLEFPMKNGQGVKGYVDNAGPPL